MRSAGDGTGLWNLREIDQSPDLKREFLGPADQPQGPEGPALQVCADTREDARSRIAITGESLQQLLNRGRHAQGVTSPTVWPPQRMVPRRMVPGAVDEAIVKIHSSINLGCVRNPPSRGQDSTEGQLVHDPFGLSPDSSLLGGRQLLCAGTYMLAVVYRLELEDDWRRGRSEFEVQTEALGCVIRDRSTAENSFCRCTACQLAKGPRASVPMSCTCSGLRVGWPDGCTSSMAHRRMTQERHLRAGASSTDGTGRKVASCMTSEIGPPRPWQWLASNLSTHETWRGRGDQGVGWGWPKAARRIDARPNTVSVLEVPAGPPFLYVQEMYHSTGCSLGPAAWERTPLPVAEHPGQERAGHYQTDQETQGKHASHSRLTRTPRKGRYSLEASVVTAQLWPFTQPASRPQRHVDSQPLSAPVVHTNMAVKGQPAAAQAPTAAATHRRLCVDMWVHVLPCTYLTATSDRACA